MTGSPGWRAAVLVTAAVLARGCWPACRRLTAGRDRWVRSNFRGRSVSLAGGLAAALALLVVGSAVLALTASADDAPEVRRVGLAMLLVVVADALVGLYDDLYGDTSTKGFRGHLRALRRRRVSSGLAKLAVICAAAAGAALVLSGGDLGSQQVVDAGVIAGSANLANLLDLRPGRALKALLLVSAPATFLAVPSVGIVLAAPAGVAAGLLPPDLAERAMLGDGGANAIGGAVGVGLAASGGLATSSAVLAGLVAVTALSEVVSFSTLIERVGPLRWLDRLGRAA